MTAIDRVLKMKNPIQTYAWGSRTAVAELMGTPSPSTHPQAEVWMGAHIKASSQVWYQERWQPLQQVILHYPQQMLGAEVAQRFNNTLPYLFKVLAADKPLSIQAHPDKSQARAGFHRENLKNIAMDAPQRNYKDDQHKPECLCALTPFWGLCGFRTLPDMMNLIGPVWPQAFNSLLTTLTRAFSPGGLQELFQQLMVMEPKRRKQLISAVVEKAKALTDKEIAYHWVTALSERYPSDLGVISPLLLNVLKLDPGEAIFLPARQLHAYLSGLGVELMANSDNVLRGGLTPKHVDIDELLTILDFNPHTPDKMIPGDPHAGESVYPCPAEEFSLSELVTAPDRPYQIQHRQKGPEIILNVDGCAKISVTAGQDAIDIEQGHSVFVPAVVKSYIIEGDARLFKAGVNFNR